MCMYNKGDKVALSTFSTKSQLVLQNGIYMTMTEKLKARENKIKKK